MDPWNNRHRISTVATTNEQVDVLAAVHNDPSVSTRDISKGRGISQRTVVRILKQHRYHPYHISLHQALDVGDSEKRISFCRWGIEKSIEGSSL